jgi:hypothetical protein
MTLRPLVGARRDRGARYLFITIAAFAVTVVATRWYLELSGYPQVGGGGLHVAHMLWGGLLLVVGALLIQLFVGRRALVLSALAAGVGTGLFIDEVGKFVTETNGYFFAPAAPLIYGAVLLLLLLWLIAGRTDRPTRSDAFHGALDALGELHGGRLTRSERDRALTRLDAALAGAQPDARETAVVAALTGHDADARLAAPGWVERGDAARLLDRVLPDRLERLLVRIGLLLMIAVAMLGLLIAVAIQGGVITELPASTGRLEWPTDPVWMLLLSLVWVVVGVLNTVALALSLTGRHPRGMAVAQFSVLTSLVAGGLLNAYVTQVGAIASILVQLALLLLVMDQRRRVREQAMGAG